MKKSNDCWPPGNNKKCIRELRAALTSATSCHEMLKIFKKIEAKLPENQLALDCWNVVSELYKHKQDPLQILDFGKRALNIYLKSNESNDTLGIGIHGSSFVIANILNFLGYACFELKRYNECLSYLNWAERNLNKLLLDKCDDKYCLGDLHNVHFELSRVKRVMGRGDEVIVHLKKVFEIDEKIRGKDRMETGWSAFGVSQGYLEIGNFKEALPFALRALEIFMKLYAKNSSEVTMARMRLVGIYLELGEYDKAFEQNRLYVSGVKRKGSASLLLKADAEGAKMLADLGRYQEAIELLKPVISKYENAGNQRVRALAFMVIARASCRLEKYADALEYIKVAVRILEEKGLDVGALVTGFNNMSTLCEEMEEYEMAISLVQKAMNIPELPQDDLANCSSRLFSLISLIGSGMKEMGISSLEEAVERLKDTFGSKHCHVGTAYAHLGIAYMELGKPEAAAGCFVCAKDIFDASLGPHHSASLGTSLALSAVYESMKSSDPATEFPQKFLEGLKGLGLSEQDKLGKTVHILDMIKGGDISEVLESLTSISEVSQL